MSQEEKVILTIVLSTASISSNIKIFILLRLMTLIFIYGDISAVFSAIEDIILEIAVLNNIYICILL